MVVEREVVGARQNDVLTPRVDVVDQLVLSFFPCLQREGEGGGRERENVVDDGDDLNVPYSGKFSREKTFADR